MRFTSSLLLLLLAACAAPRYEPHPWAEGCTYFANHVTRVTAVSEAEIDGLPAEVRRTTTRQEAYREIVLTVEWGEAVEAEREYEQYAVVERTRIQGEEERTELDAPIVGIPILLLREEGAWRPAEDNPREAFDVLQAGVEVGPPRFWSGAGREWRTFRGVALAGFLGYGAYREGRVRGRVVRDTTFEELPALHIGLDVEEEYERAKVVGRGWMVYVPAWGMVAKLALSGRIEQPDKPAQRFSADREWLLGTG